MNKEIYMVIIREYVKRILNLFENGTYLHKMYIFSYET